MNNPLQTLSNEVAELEHEKRKIEEQLKERKVVLLQAMQAQDLDKVELTTGTFSLARRKYWTYSDNTKQMEEALKETQKKEQQMGIAQYEEKEELRFRSKKI